MASQAAARPVIQARALSKRYRRVTALSDCSITVPEGRISALLGPNGAGKTTLLRFVAGLARPSSGDIAVLGSTPGQDPGFLADIGFLAQEIPLYRRFTAEDHIGVGAHLNPRWDGASVRQRLKSLDIPLDQAVGTLSGGQRAQVGLALTLAKRPRLLLLDEPVAALDPLARRHFLATLADAVAVGGLTVVLSSHLVADLERVCDHLILLAASRVQLCGDIDTVLAEHQVLIGPRKDTTAIEKTHTLVQAVHTARQSTLLIRPGGPVIDPAWETADVGLEELVLDYMGQAEPTSVHLAMVGEDHWPAHGVAVSFRPSLVRRDQNLRQPRGHAVPGRRPAARPGHADPGRAGPARAVLGLAASGQGTRTGTSQFAWMQSVTRRHWLTVKTGWILLAAAAWGGAVSALVTWWSGPENALNQQSFNPGQFDIQGIVPVGYALFAVALGIAAGTLARRVLPALAITLGVFAAMRVVIANYVRPHYMTAIITTFSPTRPVSTPAGSLWLAPGTGGPPRQALPQARPGLATAGTACVHP